MMYVSQIVILYTLNLHSAVCQLYLNKTGRKKKKEWQIREGPVLGTKFNFTWKNNKWYNERVIFFFFEEREE